MEKFSTARTAQILDISTTTLKRWYKWYEDPNYTKPLGLKLPTYTTDNRGTRFFTMEAIQQLEDFKNKLQSEYKGCMAEFNAYYQWGRRGTRIMKNKELKNNE
jgi:hypothetical protein